MYGFESGGNNEIIKQPVSNTGVSDVKKINVGDIVNKTKKQINILQFLDEELEIPEEKQHDLMKKILKYNIFDKVKDEFDLEGVLKLIKEKEVVDKEKEVVDKEKEVVDKEKEVVDKEKEVVDKEKEVVDNIHIQKNNKTFIEKNIGNKNVENQELEGENQELEGENQELENNKEELGKYKKIIDFLKIQKGLDVNNEKYGIFLSSLFEKGDNPNLEISDIETELNSLKSNPELFISLADDLGGVGSEGYESFKNLVVQTSIGKSFNKYFQYYEDLKNGTNLSSEEVVEAFVETMETNSGGIVEIDLKKRPPVNRMRLVGSEYSFDKKIDKKELDNIILLNDIELNNIEKKGFGVLNNFLGNIDNPNLDISILKELYTEFDIGNQYIIEYMDLEDFKNANTPEEKRKIFKEKLEPKLLKIKEIIIEKKVLILEQYEKELKELLSRKKERKEKELKVLKFLHSTGFDLIPKEKTDQLIREIKSNSININGLEITPSRLDLQNGVFGESSTESDGTKWQENLINFLNKLIYGEVNPKNSPLQVKDFFSVMGSSINPTELQLIFIEQGIKVGSSWSINKMRENLKK